MTHEGARLLSRRQYRKRKALCLAYAVAWAVGLVAALLAVDGFWIAVVAILFMLVVPSWEVLVESYEKYQRDWTHVNAAKS